MQAPSTKSQSSAKKRLYARAYNSSESRAHLQPMYTSVWICLVHNLLHIARNHQTT